MTHIRLALLASVFLSALAADAAPERRYALFASVTKSGGPGHGLTATNGAYRGFLPQTLRVQHGDLVYVHALVGGTHEPPPGDQSVAEFTAYISCNGARVSPYARKSLRRYKGNHHGSFTLSGYCRIPKDVAQARIEVMVRSSSTREGRVNYGGQTLLFIDHYRLAADADPGSSWYPVRAFSADNGGNGFRFQNPGHAYSPTPFYRLLLVNQSLRQDDLVYLSAQGTAEDPNKEIPMFGFRLDAIRHGDLRFNRNGTYDMTTGTRRVAVATENPLRGGLTRITQNLVGMWPAPGAGIYSFISLVYGREVAPDLPDMRTERKWARLEGLVFRKGRDAASLTLAEPVRIAPAAALTVGTGGAAVNLGAPTTVRFTGTGVARIKSYATLEYAGSKARHCTLRIGVKKGGAAERFSVLATRSFQAPYRSHNLQAEWILPVEAGNYVVRPHVVCTGSADSNPVRIEPVFATTLVDRFEK